MFYIVYKITNKLNEKIYIGVHKTENLNDEYMGSGTYLKKAQQKYGIENFKKEILFQCNSKNEMYSMESKLVNEEFVKRKDTYNIKEGGQGGWCNSSDPKFLKYLSDEFSQTGNKKFVEKFYNNKKFRDNHIKQLKNNSKLGVIKFKKLYPNGAFCNKKHSVESKKKIGQANSKYQKGKGNSQYGTCWIYNKDLEKNKKIKKEELITWISEGWIKGRKMK